MPITINGSGTLTGLSAGGLPDGSITSDDLAAGAVTAAKLAAGAGGKVVNVAVSSFYTTQESTTSTSYVDTNFTATYTPSSASNKVLIIHQFNEGARRGYQHEYDIKRTVGATTTQLGSSYSSGLAFSYTDSNDSNRIACLTYLDSPATTSQITYRLIHRAGSSSFFQYVYNNNSPAYYIFMEIAP